MTTDGNLQPQCLSSGKPTTQRQGVFKNITVCLKSISQTLLCSVKEYFRSNTVVHQRVFQEHRCFVSKSYFMNIAVLHQRMFQEQRIKELFQVLFSSVFQGTFAPSVILRTLHYKSISTRTIT
jgi:hypothetical protein